MGQTHLHNGEQNMSELRLDIRVTGCPNKCFHCHSCGGGKTRAFFDIETIVRTASFFRESLDTDVSVLLLDEQTCYPDFFELITALETEGFMRKTSSKLLVTNCWGLRHVPEFTDRFKEHYSMMIPTLFGVGKTHDLHTRRKGSYDDILEASKDCLKKGIEVIWHLHWSRQNTNDMNELYEIGKDMGIEKVFISGEYYFLGYISEEAEKFLPIYDDLDKIKHEIEEYKDGLLKTAGQHIKDIKNGIKHDVKKVAFDEIYVDDNQNVYPFMHISDKYCLGNLVDSPNEVIKHIKIGDNLPEAILAKRKLDFSELVIASADPGSNQLHTPQSLFDKLCYERGL
jgi:sulfatase maturation enzyme AslB (radical SAM superfamily)